MTQEQSVIRYEGELLIVFYGLEGEEIVGIVTYAIPAKLKLRPRPS